MAGNDSKTIHPQTFDVPEYAATRVAVREGGTAFVVVCDRCGELDKTHGTIISAEAWSRSHAQMPHEGDNGDTDSVAPSA